MRDRNVITGLEVLRRQRGLSQADVALLTGMSQIRVSEIERGMRPIGEQLRALRDAFGMPESVEFLLTETIELAPEVPAPPDLAERLRALRERGRKE